MVPCACVVELDSPIVITHTSPPVRRIKWAEGLVWRVDGEVTVSGTSAALVTDLEPGDHTVTLAYTVPDAETVETSVTVNAWRCPGLATILSLRPPVTRRSRASSF